MALFWRKPSLHGITERSEGNPSLSAKAVVFEHGFLFFNQLKLVYCLFVMTN